MMSLGERIKVARENAGLTQVQLAEKLGISRGAVANWEKKDANNPETGRVGKIAEILGVSTSWLMEDTGDQRESVTTLDRRAASDQDADMVIHESGTMDLSMGRPNALPAPQQPRPDRVNKVPVLGTAEAGKDGIFEFNGGEPIYFADRPPGLAHRPRVYCIYVAGNSMDPAHEAGALLFIDGGRAPFPGRDALIELNPEREDDGQPLRAFIKRVVKLTPEFIELKEFQPKERTFRLARSRIRNLHLVLKNTDMY